MIEALAFYLFAGILTLSGLCVITARNPVHAVLFLILAFFNASGLFVLLGAEFIALILVIVYVGAVAVLFLFVVMMLDISFGELRKGAMQYVPFGLGIAAVLLMEFVFLYSVWAYAPNVIENRAAPLEAFGDVTNTEALGGILYTDYVLPFQISGLVLLVAMIGAIVLTHRQRPGVRRQKVGQQYARTRDQAVEIVHVEPGTGA
ncbi:MAG TPA: NADH-quinone oxidoreductase subunit J [Alphaproteobacteria bacterium]|nr:NADH-quinone oxidoreductase subunit J [Alphaproteobacteria bacterium]